MADCDNDQECEKIVPTPIKPEPLPKQCSGGGESGEGTNDFNELDNRPKYGGRKMTGDTNIPAYSNFTGTDGQSDGAAGLVPAPTASDANKFLKSDGTWGTAEGGGPITVWEVDGKVVTTGLVAVGEDISANPNWQLTGLDLTPFARIKIYSKAAQKAGVTASASTTPAIILEMLLDPRAAIAEYDGNYVASNVVQKPNDPNRFCTLCCAVSADKTKFEVLRMTNLYGTSATSNSDVNAYVFKIEGYYD